MRNNTARHNVRSDTSVFCVPGADLFKVISGGPQPRNTLKDSYSSQFLRQNKRISAKESTRTPQALPLQKIVGDNVPRSNKPSIASVEFQDSPAKRQKIEHESGEQTSSPLTGSEEIDPLGFDDSIVPSLAKGDRRTSRTMLGLSVPRDRPKPGLGRVQEYHNVESRMRSTPNRNRRNRKPPAKDVVQLDPSESQAGQAQARPTPINISDDDEQEAAVRLPSKYKGTAGEAHKNLLLANKLPADGMRDTGEQSRHFASRQQKLTEVRPVVEIPMPIKQRHIEREEPRLNDQFIAINGKRKNQDFTSSPDALQGDNTVGGFRNDPAVKLVTELDTSRQASPSKSSSSTRRGSPIKDNQSRLSPSIIRASTFNSVKGKATDSKLHGQKDLAQEADPDWGIQLAAVNGVQGRVLKSSSLGFQYNDKTKSFDVIDSSKNLGKDDFSFRLQIPKLRKIMWSKDGVEVRFESARIEGVEHLLDIELHKESEVSVLLQKLQENHHHFRIMGVDRYVDPFTFDE